MLKACATNIAI